MTIESINALIVYTALLSSAALWWHHYSIRDRRTRLLALAVTLLGVGMAVGRIRMSGAPLLYPGVTWTETLISVLRTATVLSFIPCMSAALDLASGIAVEDRAPIRWAVFRIALPVTLLTLLARSALSIASLAAVNAIYMLIVRLVILALVTMILLTRLARLQRRRPKLRGVAAMSVALLGTMLNVGYRAVEAIWRFEAGTSSSPGQELAFAIAHLFITVSLSFGAWLLLLDIEHAEAMEAEERATDAEVALEQARSQLLAAFEGTSDPLAFVDTRGRLLAWNAALTARSVALGLPRPTAATPLSTLAPAEAKESWERLLRDVTTQRSVIPVEYPAHATMREQMTLSAVRQHATVTGAIALVRDVTAVRELEDRVRRSELLERLGQMAAGIAHDFNNVLGVVSLSAELAQQSLGDEQATRAELSHLFEAAERGRSLTRQLLAFARQQPGETAIFDANHRLRELEVSLSRQRRREVLLRLQIPSEPSFLRMDESQFDQLALNLVGNAIDASSDGAPVDVALQHLRVERNGCEEALQLPAGRYVVLQVTDRGIGIAPELLGRVFEPFVSTKQSLGGTGLGLSTCYGIARQAGGIVRVQSQEGEGTVAEVWLPTVA